MTLWHHFTSIIYTSLKPIACHVNITLNSFYSPLSLEFYVTDVERLHSLDSQHAHVSALHMEIMNYEITLVCKTYLFWEVALERNSLFYNVTGCADWPYRTCYWTLAMKISASNPKDILPQCKKNKRVKYLSEISRLTLRPSPPHSKHCHYQQLYSTVFR